MHQDSEGSGPLLRLTPWLLAALAFIVRSLPAASVFVGDHILLVSYDAFYRLRRIRYRLGDATAPLDVDPYVHFPLGGKPVMPSFFDALLAELVRPFAGFEDRERMEAILVWVPPLIGALTVVALFHLARRFFGLRTAVASSLLLCILPAHVYYSRLSFIDHHVAVSLASTVLLAFAMTLLSRASHPKPGASLVRIGALLGLLYVINLLLWPGSILHIAIVEIAFLLGMMRLHDRDSAIGIARALVVQNALAFVLLLPIASSNDWPQWGAYSSVVLSWFQPWFFGSQAVCVALCLWLWRRPGVGRSRNARTLQSIGLGACTLLASAVCFPALVEGVFDAWVWMTSEDAFQRVVAESRPLFRLNHQFTTTVAVATFTGLMWAFPLCGAAMLAFERKRLGGAAYLLVGWAAVFSAATIAQNRYKNSLSVAFALIVGWGIVRLDAALRARVGSSQLLLATRLVLAAALVFCVWGTLGHSWRQLEQTRTTLAGGTPSLDRQTRLSLQQQEVAEWLRDNTPVTSGAYDSALRPEYSVYTPWGLGHTVKYVAQRPTVVDNFGEYVGRERFALADSVDLAYADEARRLLDSFGARYIVVRGALSKPRINRQLYLGETIVPGFRLRWESTPGAADELSEYQVFERVAGASVIGRAEPGSRITARLGYRTNQGRRGVMRQTVETDLGGVYRLELPYPTSASQSEIALDDVYRLIVTRRSGDGFERSLTISESQVAQGDVIEGLDFRGQSSLAPAPGPSDRRQ